ncbi:ABC-2 family transporter protein [Candidatus Izimaplasma bacterium HR1]|jgi:ABC-2 type transport system permease protein|uniref:ABC transporter permease subunit n=1 Tax=Candidatus Izimoplasma sp. HR1 TaxID=1541959 RepID=UPI0004F8AAB0|nr:ABC-2 family transporter protein [Candidatus Izimaplasma bacterium HR1]
MNIIIRELKANFKAFLIWGLSLVGIYFIASIEFGAFAGDLAIAEAMERFEALFTALGSASSDMTTAEGFLSILSIYIYLPLAIYSGLLGSGIISKEEKDRTAEYLFTLPISRKKVISYKLIVAIFYSVLINIIVILGCYFAFSRFDPDPVFYTFLRNMSIGVLLTQLIFLSIGVALSSILRQYKLSGSITIALLISTFMLNILIGFVDELDFLKYFSPFNYFNSEKMLITSFEFPFLLITFVIVSLGIGSLLIYYPKRDLYI